MPSLQEFEQHFWSQVWQCTHKQSCKKCCWPWRLREPPATLRDLHQITTSPGLALGLGGSAPRVALILAHHALILPSARGFVVAHQCDFAICCNPLHLSVGTPRDNMADIRRRGGHWKRRQSFGIYLPTSVPFDLGQFINAAMAAKEQEREKARQAAEERARLRWQLRADGGFSDDLRCFYH